MSGDGSDKRWRREYQASDGYVVEECVQYDDGDVIVHRTLTSHPAIDLVRIDVVLGE